MSIATIAVIFIVEGIFALLFPKTTKNLLLAVSKTKKLSFYAVMEIVLGLILIIASLIMLY